MADDAAADRWFETAEDDILQIAKEEFPDALELAINTEDEDLFLNVINSANRILLDRTLSGLVEKGLVEIAGIDESGDFMFGLTEAGRIEADKDPREYELSD